MTKTKTLTAALLAFPLLVTPAFAQEAPAAAPQAPPVAPEAPQAAPQNERLDTLEGKVDGLNESLLETRSSVDKLNKIKWSGYIQGRYEWHDDAKDGLSAAGKPTETTQFLIRRGRLKAQYEGANSEYVLQIDATPKGVVLKDAEASIHGTWDRLNLKLTLGQFKWPFGYEVLQSSGDREMPERARMIRAFWPGERDRGARIQAKYDVMRLALALVNGNGTEDAVYTANDQTAFKDVVGRFGVDLGHFVGGVSGYYGHNLKTTPAGAAKVDLNADGTCCKYTAATPASYSNFSRLRIGADVQKYLNLLPFGGTALKAEFIYGKDKSIAYGSTPADSTKDVASWGWYGLLVQNVGDHFGVVVRVDQYEPNDAVDSDRITTVGGGLLAHVSGNAKITVAYDHPISQVASGKTDPGDDALTMQLQGRF